MDLRGRLSHPKTTFSDLSIAADGTIRMVGGGISAAPRTGQGRRLGSRRRHARTHTVPSGNRPADPRSPKRSTLLARSSDDMSEASSAVARVPHPVGVPAAATFEDFFHAESPVLYRRLCLLTRDRNEAEDVLQDTFLRLWERWDRVAEMEDPTGYLYRTAMNVFRSRYRRALLAQLWLVTGGARGWIAVGNHRTDTSGDIVLDGEMWFSPDGIVWDGPYERPPGWGDFDGHVGVAMLDDRIIGSGERLDSVPEGSPSAGVVVGVFLDG